MSRQVVYSSIVNDAQLRDLGLTESGVYENNSANDPAERPFVILDWGTVTTTFGFRVSGDTERLQIWVHDTPGDYTRLRSILERIKNIMVDHADVPGTDGYALTQMDWRGDSGDLWDDGYKTITKNAAFDVISRRIP